MTSGFPEIDAQHKEWITRFNAFNQAVVQHKGAEAFSDALMFFIRYTETHFRTEETLMKVYHCSGEGLNKQEHDKFQKRVQEITYQTWPLGATEEDVLNLKAELGEWLVSHICKVDIKLREVVKKP
jgi:hemerythrin-like metal-binding protein